MKKPIKVAAVVFAVIVSIFIYTHLSSYFVKRGSKTQDVIVAISPVIQQNITIPLQTIGNVEASSTVSIKSLVDGELLRVGFNQGDFVKKGQVLFEIDPRPYQAKLQQAEANLKKDEAQLKNAEQQLDRTKLLAKKGYLSQQDYDQLIANKESLAATVQADQAALTSVQLQLTYATITSPMDGRSGSLLVYPGNVIKTSSNTPLVTITQIMPISVSFAVPEQYLTAIFAEQQRHPVTVQAMVGGQLEQGQLTFIDNSVDSTTGTIKLKANFANAQQKLWPGQYVTVTIPTATLFHALLIPSRAIQVGQNGPYVYVIKADHTASYRPVKVGPIVNNNTVVTQGLQVNEEVAIDGQVRLVEGTAVKIAPETNV